MRYDGATGYGDFGVDKGPKIPPRPTRQPTKMSQVRRAACAGLLRGTWRTKGSDGKGRRVSIEGVPTHLARRPIEDKVEKSIGHVWAVHLSLHVERNPRAVSAHDAAVEPAAALQCVPDHDNQYGYRSRWSERTNPDAVGYRALMVEEESQGDASDVQCPRRDRGRKADVSIGVQANTMSDPGERMGRMEGYRNRRADEVVYHDHHGRE